MTKSEWLTIAEVLSGLRASVVASWPPSEGFADPLVFHHRKLVYLAQLEALDKTSTTIAAALDRSCSKFDRHHFLRIVRAERLPH